MGNTTTQTGNLSNTQLSNLLEFAQKLNMLQSVDDIAWETVCFVARYLNVDDCVFYACHITRPTLIQLAAYGPHKSALREILNPIEIDLGSGIVGTVAQTGVGENIGDTSLDPRYIVDDDIRLSELSVPIVSRGHTYGVIDTEHTDRNYYTQDQFEFVTLIAQQVAPVLAAVLLEQTLNSKDFARQATSAFLRVMKHNVMTPLSVVLMKSQILSKGVYGETTPKQQRAIDQITDNTRVVVGLLGDVFEYVHLESGHVPLRLQTTTVQNIEAELVGKLAVLTQQAGIRLNIQNDVANNEIEVDHALIVKAIQRVCQIACQDMQQNDQLLVTFRMDAEELIIEVMNYLPAITRMELQTMLRPFGNIRDDQENILNSRHGLELTLVQQTLELHAGTLEISNLEDSNVFLLRIPV